MLLYSHKAFLKKKYFFKLPEMILGLIPIVTIPQVM